MSVSAEPRLLFVGGAGPISSSRDIVSDALNQARARGIRTHILSRAELLAETKEVTALADEVSVVDPDDPVACARWARERSAAGDRFELVLGLRDTVLAAVAECARVFGAVGNSPDAVSRVRNKDTCREALAAAGFRQPSVRLCDGVGQAAEFLAASTGPWVVKPRDGMASIGVRKVSAPADLPAAIEALPDRELFLVEEFVSGPEFSVEGVFLGGRPRVLAVTEKEKLPPPHFVESGHLLPADLPEERAREIERQVTAALTALGLCFGVFHVELWLCAGEVVLGEVHVRPGGDWLHRLLAHAIPGLELFGLIFDDLLGRPSTGCPAPTRAGAARFLTARPGRLVRIEGWERVRDHPAVLHAELTVRPGDRIGPVHQSGDRAGVVVVGADTPEAARDLARRLAGAVRFTVDGD
ncbi:ATP-grasp domain-containing protein [Amycolatopsis roodepoortensis]|uniref:Biotin carboxylase n=1 Tax=Amycolatopsis roodepoortensis TaxID=700274 RepID=A0ABR9L194_9PSEU|nr:ATP-grasp domain-containing protein [Amycolatopsis roodepoortensis]MBE1574394.1 biotin carboxylase [Amycolatopsis roodepoortensis]